MNIKTLKKLALMGMAAACSSGAQLPAQSVEAPNYYVRGCQGGDRPHIAPPMAHKSTSHTVA